MIWEDNYLAHHGIKGQKWGVRRFELYDGTLTPEGKKRYNRGVHHEDNVRKDYHNYVNRNAQKIKRIKDMSELLKKMSKERDAAYEHYYSTVKLDANQKKTINQVLDSWYGAGIDEGYRETFEQDVDQLVRDTLYKNTPASIQKIDKAYNDSSEKYWNAANDFTNAIIKEYSQTSVYIKEGGIFSNHRMYGENFIKKLISEDKLDFKLGEYEPAENNSKGTIYRLIGAPNYEKEGADASFEKAVDRLSKDFSVEQYNARKDAENAAVKRYRKQHPSTELSDARIMEMTMS